ISGLGDNICCRRPAPPLKHLPRVCRSYEDCCGTRCCVRALSIQKLWYFW
uniref:Uncharacterized protein n=1 Tax=Stegastes partitus TaxID=144197 RepID=A0A3B5AX98_9TELE